MALATYANLQDFIQAKFDDTGSLSDDVVADCIDMGESLINGDLRLRGREMETTSDLTISSQETALPTGCLGVRRLYLDKDPNKPLQYFPPADFWRRYGSSVTATPEIYTIEAGNIVVAPVPSSSETGKILCWKENDILTTVPALFTNHPQIYVYATSIFAADFLDDDRQVTKCSAMYDQLADKYAEGNKRDRYPSGQLTMVSDVNPNFRGFSRGFADN